MSKKVLIQFLHLPLPFIIIFCFEILLQYVFEVMYSKLGLFCI